MNDKDVCERLLEVGWQEIYERKQLKRYYRFKVVTTSGGPEFFYVDRNDVDHNDADARICMHPKFAKHVELFGAIPGVRTGMVKSADLLGKSSYMREFPLATGETSSKAYCKR